MQASLTKRDVDQASWSNISYFNEKGGICPKQKTSSLFFICAFFDGCYCVEEEIRVSPLILSICLNPGVFLTHTHNMIGSSTADDNIIFYR